MSRVEFDFELILFNLRNPLISFTGQQNHQENACLFASFRNRVLVWHFMALCVDWPACLETQTVFVINCCVPNLSHKERRKLLVLHWRRTKSNCVKSWADCDVTILSVAPGPCASRGGHSSPADISHKTLCTTGLRWSLDSVCTQSWSVTHPHALRDFCWQRAAGLCTPRKLTTLMYCRSCAGCSANENKNSLNLLSLFPSPVETLPVSWELKSWDNERLTKPRWQQCAAEVFAHFYSIPSQTNPN